ncbi:MAG: T9SS type A sorting domain-containing protein [Bacteroidia bacterium]|nr:T9SS type A sorting domain-containing protein [Bacteroidia bacterium]
METEFHAESGSETRLFIEETFPVCTDFSAYRTSATPSAEQTGNDIRFKQEIEIQFKKKLAEMDFTIYPNPNNGRYTLAVNTLENLNVNALMEIFSLVGNKVYTQVISTSITNIDVSALTKGIYMIKFSYNNKVESKKLVIQ